MSLIKEWSENEKLKGYLDELVSEIEEDLECTVVSLGIVLEAGDGICVASVRKGE